MHRDKSSRYILSWIGRQNSYVETRALSVLWNLGSYGQIAAQKRAIKDEREIPKAGIYGCFFSTFRRPEPLTRGRWGDFLARLGRHDLVKVDEHVNVVRGFHRAAPLSSPFFETSRVIKETCHASPRRRRRRRRRRRWGGARNVPRIWKKVTSANCCLREYRGACSDSVKGPPACESDSPPRGDTPRI